MHNETRKEIKMISRIILEDLINPAAKLFDFHSYKVFVSLSLCAISYRRQKNRSPCTIGGRTESTRKHVASFNNRTRDKERDRESEKQALSEQGG